LLELDEALAERVEELKERRRREGKVPIERLNSEGETLH
jgi:hypothetical protein